MISHVFSPSQVVSPSSSDTKMQPDMQLQVNIDEGMSETVSLCCLPPVQLLDDLWLTPGSQSHSQVFSPS